MNSLFVFQGQAASSQMEKGCEGDWVNLPPHLFQHPVCIQH